METLTIIGLACSHLLAVYMGYVLHLGVVTHELERANELREIENNKPMATRVK